MAGISNHTIVKLIEKNTNDDLKGNFIGVFPFYINKFINLHDLLIQSGATYPFVIMNTDRSDKKRHTLVEFFKIHIQKKKFYLIDLDLKDLKNL